MSWERMSAIIAHAWRNLPRGTTSEQVKEAVLVALRAEGTPGVEQEEFEALLDTALEGHRLLLSSEHAFRRMMNDY